MFVKIYKLGEEEVINEFYLGAHILGRGPILQCDDKRVSRNHATLEVTPNHVKLTSIHINPCFLKAANGKTITIIKKDESTELGDGDTFALLPDDYWFKIKVLKDEETPPDKRIKTEEILQVNENEIKVESSEVQPTTSSVEDEDLLKRPLEDTEEGTPPDKRLKTEETIQANENEIKVESTETEIQATTSTAEACDTTSTENGEFKEEEDAPSTSNPKPRRERCWYADKCYRKNPAHRQEYTHPGDSDFESDPDDNRPTCGYGASCYRKNKKHRRDYKHPPRQPPGQKKRQRKKVQRLNAADSEEMRELLDSEEEDPFIDDDSEEYDGESDDGDSDWEDSQNVDEDSENVKMLVKEAKKFVNK